MKALIIIGSICAFFIALGLISVKATVISSDGFTFFLKVLFFKIRVFPKKPPDPGKFTKKKLEKQKKKEEKKRLKKEKKKKKAEAPPEEAKKKDKLDQIRELVDLGLDVAKSTLPAFGSYLRITVKSLKICIAGDDAAKTALTYGYVSQGVAYLCELLDNATNFKKTSDDSIFVGVDFLSDRIKSEINVTFAIRVWQALSLGLKALFAYMRHGNKDKKTN